MTLADQIIEHGPWTRSDPIPGHLRIMMSDGLNELRDELLELRRLRAAAQARERYSVDTLIGGEDEPDSVALYCPNCRWDVYPDAPVPLAELVRRADQHTQDCP